MKVKIRLLFVINLLAAFILFGGLSAHAGDVRGVTSNTVLIGICSDLTGPSATELEAATAGLKLYFRQSNDKGGINGRKIKLKIGDDRHSIPTSIAVFKKLVFRDEVMAIWGPSSTGAGVALFPIINKYKVPTLITSCSDKLALKFSRYTFGHQASYVDQTQILYDFLMNDLKPSNLRLGIVYPDSEYGKIGLKTARKRADFYGVNIIAQEVLSYGTVDATTQVLGLKRAKVNYVIVKALVSTVIPLLKGAKKFGYSPVFLLDWVTCHEATVKIAKDAAKNCYGVHNYSSWHEKSLGMEKIHNTVLKYFEKPKRYHYSNLHSLGWVTGMVVTEGIDKAGRDLNAETFIDALETLDNFDTGGLCGNVTYTSTRHKAGRYGKMYKADIEKEKFVPITDWIEPLSKR